MIWALITAAWAGELALQIDTRELVVGQAVPIKLSVINGKAESKPTLPVGEGLLAQYQGQSSQHMIVNFETTRIIEYNYQLAATKAGTWTVGPVELVVDGERLIAGPVEIEVGQPPVTQGSAPVVATITDASPVLGQVVVYRFQFQYDRPLVNARWSRPEFPGFVEEVHAEAAQREYQIVQDGKPLTVQTIEVPLVAAGTGLQRIGAAGLTAQFRTQKRRRRRGGIDELFGDSPFGLRGSTETQTFATDAIEVDIQPLPVDAQPPGYSGLVGRFDVRVEPSAESVKLGESVTLTIDVVGDGTLAGFTLPQLPADAGFRAYDDAPVIKTKLLDGRFRSKLTVRRAVVPEAEGILTVPPVSFVVYDPGEGQYRTVNSEPLTLTVLPGEEGGGVITSFAGESGDQRRDVVSLGEDVLPVAGGQTVGDRTVTGARTALAGVVAFPALAWGLLAGLVWWRGRTPDPVAVLRQRLVDLPQEPGSRLAEIEAIFREAAALRLGVAAPGLDSAAVAALGDEPAKLYGDLERARYGGGQVDDLETRVRAFLQGKAS